MNVDIPTYLSFFSGIGGLDLAVRLVAPAGADCLGDASFTRLEGRELGDPRNENRGGADATWIN
jgi:hypothetical protein